MSVLKAVADLMPGDQIAAVRTVVETHRTAGQMVASFDDGTTQSWDLAGDPTVPVVNG